MSGALEDGGRAPDEEGHSGRGQRMCPNVDQFVQGQDILWIGPQGTGEGRLEMPLGRQVELINEP